MFGVLCDAIYMQMRIWHEKTTQVNVKIVRRARISNMHLGCNSSQMPMVKERHKKRVLLTPHFHMISFWLLFCGVMLPAAGKFHLYLSPTTILLRLWEKRVREAYTHISLFVCMCRGASSSFETPNAQSILQFVHQVVINKLNTLCGRRGRGGIPIRPAVRRLLLLWNLQCYVAWK